jgi:hypothetical protein
MQIRAVLVSIFLISLSTLAFEIALLRVFSVSLWYHFGFMIISIAMLGIGASGTVLYLFPGINNIRVIPLYCLLTGVSIVLSYMITNLIPFDPARAAWDRVQLFYVLGYYVFLSLPFLLTGLAISTALSSLKEQAGIVYGADLLGAGIGVVLTLLLLGYMNPEKAILLLSLPALGSAAVFGGRIKALLSLMIILVVTALMVFTPSVLKPRVSPYKSFSLAMRYPGAEHIRTLYSPYCQVDIFKSPAVRFAPGLSFQFLKPLPEQIGIAVDAEDITAVTVPRSRDELGFIDYLPMSLPYYLLHKKEDILLLEPRGGLDVLIGQYHNAKRLYKVDSNPVVIEAVRGILKGSQFDPYRKDTWAGLGRTWLFSTDRKFDLISLSPIGAFPRGGFGFSEDYRFTVEAFLRYLEHLKPEGLLSITLFILPPPRIEFRILNTLYEAMTVAGIKNVSRHVAAIRTWGTLTIVAKKSPLTERDIQQIREFSKQRGFDLVYYPGITETESNVFVKMPTNQYFIAFKRLLNPETRKAFMENYIFDIAPVYDDNPFFHYFMKLANIREIYKTMGQKWQYFIEEGYLLPLVLLQVTILSTLVMLLPLCRLNRGSRRLLSGLFYFGLLGAGYMFVEVSLFQRLLLPLENPSYTATTVIFSLLLSSALGSLTLQRSHSLRSPSILLFIFLLLLLYSLLLSPIINLMSPLPLWLRVVTSFLFILPVGFLMGIPFPLGILSVGSTSQAFVPWAWAINGCLSVLSPILAIMIALSLGFKKVILLAAVAYLLGFFLLKRR